jgi:hypothetical protein
MIVLNIALHGDNVAAAEARLRALLASLDTGDFYRAWVDPSVDREDIEAALDRSPREVRPA